MRRVHVNPADTANGLEKGKFVGRERMMIGFVPELTETKIVIRRKRRRKR
jgi:hypothetical protein